MSAKSKKLSPLRKDVAKTEDQIENREARMAQVNEALLAASQAQDGPKIQQLSKELAMIEAEIESLFEILEEKSDVLDNLEKEFDLQLSELERD